MARRKHRGHKTRRRRRNVGALNLKGKDTTMKLVALAAGFLIGPKLNAAIDKANTATSTTGVVTNKVDPTIIMVGEIGVGGLLLMRKKSNMILKLGGGVLAGAGLRRAIGKMGLMNGFMNGFQSVPVIGRPRMAGYQSVPVLGASMPPQLSGPQRTPMQLQGFRVNGYVPTGSGVMGGIGATDNASGITNTGGGCCMG
jgi:hypothetical protein